MDLFYYHGMYSEAWTVHGVRGEMFDDFVCSYCLLVCHAIGDNTIVIRQSQF